IGEQKLAEALAGVEGLRVLHDRRVPGTRGNIDHIVVSPAGVFVIDAKLYRGVIRVRDRGTLFKKDDRLYVGGRDCSRLAENMTWQVSAICSVLASVDVQYAGVPVQPVLCFVDGEWAFFTPSSYKGVRLEGLRSIKKLLTSVQALNPVAVNAIAGILSNAFPPK
ncbi:MAG TPA: nuclease-related domain-containing protein, partial [Candidatus Dormibacteraeota bacterium]|nr:nuclease-related domain-containing protein [Candidatus Dormibacteraeota bacterium]